MMRAVNLESLRSFFTTSIFFVALLAMAMNAMAQSCPTVSFPPGPAVKMAVNPATGKVYTLNEDDDTVTVYNPHTATSTTLGVGDRPYFVAVNPVTNRIYVNSVNDSTVVVIDGATDTVSATLPVGSLGPIQVNPVTNTIYVVRFTGTGTDEVTFINGDTNEYYTIATESFQPIAVASNPVTNKIYVNHYATGDIRVISGAYDGNAHPVTTSVGTYCQPFAIAVNPVTNKVYFITNDTRGPVGVLDGTDNSVVFPSFTADPPTNAKAIAVNPVTNTVYMVFEGKLVTLDGSTNGYTVSPLATGSGPVEIAIDTQRNVAYIANADGQLFTIGGSGSTITIPAGATSLGVNPLLNEVYVFGSSLTVVPGAEVAPSTNQLTATITPLASNSGTTSGSISVSAASTFSPNRLPVDRLLYAFDSAEGPFSTATGGGTFSIPLAGLAEGEHTLYVVPLDRQDAPLYTGAVSPMLGTLASYTFTVTPGTKATPSVSLAAASNPSTFGQSVTFTMSVTGSSGTPTGTITLRDNGVNVTGCTALTLASGSASCSLSTLAVGTHPLTASYSGDDAYESGISDTINQVVNKATATNTLASSVNPSTTGQSVTFTATLTGVSGAAVPTGTVSFLEGSTAICSAVAVPAGTGPRTVTCTTSSLAAGTHPVYARYSGDANYASNDSNTVSQVVNGPVLANPTVAVASSANPSTVGQSVTFTAMVSGSAGTPTGTVAFSDNNVAISGCSAVALSGGTAACTTSSLAAGAHPISASYSGDASYNTASVGMNQVVGNPPLATPAITVSTSANPSTAGQNVTFTATLSGSAGTPSGTVTFQDNGADIAACTSVAISGGSATCATSGLAVGSHSIRAQYSGDSAYDARTSDPLSQTVNPAPLANATLALDSSLNPSQSGQAVTFTLDLSGSAGTPTGTVQFLDGGAAISGCASVTVSGGAASCSTSSLTVGSHSITAQYSGNASYNPGTSSALTQLVESAPAPAEPVNVALAANGGIATASSQWNANFPPAALINGDVRGAGYGAGGTWQDSNSNRYPDWVQVALSGTPTIDRVVVFSVQDNYTAPVEPTDTMTFSRLGLTDFQVQVLSGSTWTTVATVAGNRLVKRAVTFTPVAASRVRIWITGSIGGLSRAAEVQVWSTGGPPPAKVNPSVAIASSPNPSAAGANVTFIATVSGSAGEATGTVEFRSGGATLAGCGAAPVSGGNATCSSSAFAAGSYAITAHYSGNTAYNPASSGTLTQVVNPARASATVALSSSRNPSALDQAVTFTATLSGSSGTPTGTVAFYDGTQPICGGAVAVSGGTASCTYGDLPLGTRSITAHYSGDATYDAATSTPLNQVVTTGEPVNVALASAGTVATASSQWNANFPVSSLINGDRAGRNYGAGGTWMDSTGNAYPDWVRLGFNEAKTIDKVIVYSLQSSYTSPSEPGDSMTTSLGVSDFQVQAWNGSAWVTLATVTGNRLVKRAVTFEPVTTTAIRVVVTRAMATYSRLTEIEAWTPAVSDGGTNVALASRGATAGASSTWNSNFPASAVIDGDRSGVNFGAGGTWRDANTSYPDWVEIAFDGSHTIDRVVVYSVQDNYTSPVEPTDDMTFGMYGVTDFRVQIWSGGTWVTVGAVTANDRVKRTVSFSPVATDRIRVLVDNAAGGYSRLTEVEAFLPTGP